MNEDNSWLIVPMMLGGVVVVGLVMGLLLEFLPKEIDTQIMPTYGFIFVGGTILTALIVTTIIMFIAITQLGCCGEPAP